MGSSNVLSVAMREVLDLVIPLHSISSLARQTVAVMVLTT